MTIRSEQPPIGADLSKVPQWPCAWCGELTYIRAFTPFRPDLQWLPVHAVCQLAILSAYERWQEGRALTDRQRARLRGLYSWQPPLLATDGAQAK